MNTTYELTLYTKFKIACYNDNHNFPLERDLI